MVKRCVCLFLAVALGSIGSGCTSDPPIKPADKPRMMRQMVLHSVRLANEQPNRVPERAEQFIARLAEVKAEALDDNGALYDKLIQKYQEVADAAKSSPGSPEVKKKLAELLELGKQLPM